MTSRFIKTVCAVQPAIFMATGMGHACLGRHWLATALLFSVMQLGMLVGAVREAL